MIQANESLTASREVNDVEKPKKGKNFSLNIMSFFDAVH